MNLGLLGARCVRCLCTFNAHINYTCETSACFFDLALALMYSHNTAILPACPACVCEHQFLILGTVFESVCLGSACPCVLVPWSCSPACMLHRRLPDHSGDLRMSCSELL